jgi:GMP synthase (glutamine-hydrolysing)
MKVLALQHVAVEPPGTLGVAIKDAGLALDIVRVDRGEPIPELGDAAGLVIMGGPMSVYEADRRPHLRAELALIERALAAGVPVIGICLGSQLLAEVLGGRVCASGRQEIGWHPITLAPEAASDPLLGGAPANIMALHWHGDVFALPPGARALASSAMTPLQAFSYGEAAHGLLFHLEVTAGQLTEMTAAFADELTDHGLSSADILAGAQAHGPALEALARGTFAKWARRVRDGRWA